MNDRLDLMKVLNEQKWIRVIADGRKAIILRAVEPKPTNDKFNVVSLEFSKDKTRRSHEMIELEVGFRDYEFVTHDLACELERFLIQNGISAELDDSMSWYPIGPKGFVDTFGSEAPWEIDFSTPFGTGVFAKVTISYSPEVSNVAKAFRDYFKI